MPTCLLLCSNNHTVFCKGICFCRHTVLAVMLMVLTSHLRSGSA